MPSAKRLRKVSTFNILCYTLAVVGLIAILILPSNVEEPVESTTQGQPTASTTQGHDYLGELDTPQAFNIEIGQALQEGGGTK